LYKKVEIESFRGINNLIIDDFKRVNLFVGRNNCGKTTILEALFILINPSNPQLPVNTNKFRGHNLIDETSWRLLFRDLNTDSTIKLSAELDDQNERRSLNITPDIRSTPSSIETTILKEAIDIKDSYSGVSPVIDGLILACSLMKDEYNEPKKIESKIFASGAGLEISIPRGHKEYLQGVFINPNTIFKDIGKRFSDIQIKKKMPRIIKILRKIEPSLEGLSLGSESIIYCDIGLDRLVPINIMGDGIHRILAIILAISDTPDGIVLIDEIENGLYYTSQEILWDAVFESAKEFNVQVFATTHSIECINAFSRAYSRYSLAHEDDDIRLYRIERKDDRFRVVSYNNEILEASLDSRWEVR